MSFKYDGLIKSLDICLRNEWGMTEKSCFNLRYAIWEARKALIDCREEMGNAEHGKLPSTSKAAFSEHGLAGCVGLADGANYGFRPLDVEELEDQDYAQDHGFGSLLKRTGI
jgi:hypothetical protein